MSWFYRLSLRARLILIGVTGVGVALAAGGVLLVAVLRTVLVGTLDGGARQTAHAVALLVDQSALSDPVPAAGTQFVQVIDEGSRVRAHSLGADPLVPMLHGGDLARARAGGVVTVSGGWLATNGDFDVVATDASADDGTRIVLVAVAVGAAHQSVDTVRVALLIAYPLLLGGLAILAWRVVGVTLRPVEALRAGAEEISASHGGRLPVPGGDDEVHRLAVTLNRMLDRLAAARARQRVFVADAAHELRSPIASLGTQLEVAARLGEPPPVADLSAEVDRLARLVDDLLMLARAEDGGAAMRRREPVELADLLAAAVAGCAGARVPVTLAVDGPLRTVGDPVAVRRIVDNLLSNACRHAGSSVRVGGRRSGEWVEVSVRDDGPGVPEADRERIFDRFTRLDDARTRDRGGAGLGLAIARELTRAHDGRLTLGDAAPGLIVTLVLPRYSS